MKFVFLFCVLFSQPSQHHPKVITDTQVIRTRAPASSQTLKDFYRAIQQITGNPRINGGVRLLG